MLDLLLRTTAHVCMTRIQIEVFLGTMLYEKFEAELGYQVHLYASPLDATSWGDRVKIGITLSGRLYIG